MPNEGENGIMTRCAKPLSACLSQYQTSADYLTDNLLCESRQSILTSSLKRLKLKIGATVSSPALRKTNDWLFTAAEPFATTFNFASTRLLALQSNFLDWVEREKENGHFEEIASELPDHGKLHLWHLWHRSSWYSRKLNPERAGLLIFTF